jgi:hypothetical protein
MNVSSQLHVLANLPLQEEPLVPTEWGAGWVTEPGWTFWRREKALAPTKNWPWIAQLTAQSLHWLYDPGSSGHIILTSTKFIHEYRNKDVHHFQVSVWTACMFNSFILALTQFTLHFTFFKSVYLMVLSHPFQSCIKHNASYICSQERTHSFSRWYFHKYAIQCNCWLCGKHKCIICLAQEIIQNTLQKACSVTQCDEH